MGLTETPAPSVGPAAYSAQVPADHRAVDALGLEIFVPDDLVVDPPCPGGSVNRPGYGLTYGIACAFLAPPALWLSSAASMASGGAAPTSANACVEQPILDGEAGCVSVDRDLDATTSLILATWTKHDVGLHLQVARNRQAWALSIIRTAHWVPIDRHGCAAARTPVAVPEPPLEGGSGNVLPDDTSSLGVCWYSRNRLVGSATVDGQAAIQTIAHPVGVSNGPGISEPPEYTPQDAAPLCTDLRAAEGVLLLAHRAGRPDAESTAEFADCRGTRSWTNGTTSIGVGEPLASALRLRTGLLITNGYQVPPAS